MSAESDIALTSGLQKISPGSVVFPQNVQTQRPQSLAKTFRTIIQGAEGSSARFIFVAVPSRPSLPVTVNFSVVMRSSSSLAVNSTRSPSLFRICSLWHWASTASGPAQRHVMDFWPKQDLHQDLQAEARGRGYKTKMATFTLKIIASQRGHFEASLAVPLRTVQLLQWILASRNAVVFFPQQVLHNVKLKWIRFTKFHGASVPFRTFLTWFWYNTGCVHNFAHATSVIHEGWRSGLLATF